MQKHGGGGGGRKDFYQTPKTMLRLLIDLKFGTRYNWHKTIRMHNFRTLAVLFLIYNYDSSDPKLYLPTYFSHFSQKKTNFHGLVASRLKNDLSKLP